MNKPIPQSILEAVAERGKRSADAMIERGCSTYDRERMLPRLLPNISPTATDNEILFALRVAIAAERGRAGHWSFEPNRLIGLLQALKAEKKS